VRASLGKLPEGVYTTDRWFAQESGAPEPKSRAGGRDRVVPMLIEKLRRLWTDRDTALCIGLDPEPARFPQAVRRGPTEILDFNKAIIDATADLVCAFKPQIAYYAAHSAEEQLLATIEYIRERYPHLVVILDAKRGDIGPTAEMYARECFDRYGADAVTVNPYMGRDAVAPFLARTDKGVILLCRTSNPGARDFQDLLIDGTPLYLRVAEEAVRSWNTNNNLWFVAGASYAAELRELRAIAGDVPFLIPGVGAQGASVSDAVIAGRDDAGAGIVVSASRAVLYASTGADFAQAARRVAEELRREINRARTAR
jgi:orotidine-5'-phosphate decarboxylase